MTENKIYLVNHRPPNCESLKSITRLPKKEAFDLAKKLQKEVDVSEAYMRFKDDQFKAYYEIRMRAEKWLYEKFIEVGGKPQTKHPIYFYVHKWHMEDRFWETKVTERIELDSIDDSDISFIFGDSCGEVDRANRKEPFTKADLLEYIAEHDNDIEQLLQTVRHGMIEAQVWNEKYFMEINQNGTK